MYENTILNALKQYHRHIGTSRFNSNISLLNHIKICEKYIEQGNAITTDWMKENHTVVSKAVNYAHNFIHQNYIETDNEYVSEEHRELNLCYQFFKDYYEKLGVDITYMDIEF